MKLICNFTMHVLQRNNPNTKYTQDAQLHIPYLHTPCFLHFLLHPPQLFLLYITLTHFPLQHNHPNLHFFPHLPQLKLSVFTLTHLLWQQSCPGLPFRWHTFGNSLHVWGLLGLQYLARKRFCVISGSLFSILASNTNALDVTRKKTSNKEMVSFDIIKWYLDKKYAWNNWWPSYKVQENEDIYIYIEREYRV